MKSKLWVSIVCIVIAGATRAKAQPQATVNYNPGDPWLGFVNVFNLPAPAGDGAYQFGFTEPTTALSAVQTGATVTLGPNSVPDNMTGTGFWYTPDNPAGPGSVGNKSIDSNFYVDTQALDGDKITFNGTVLSNTFISGYTTTAFIKDFSADYSSFYSTNAPLNPGPFSITLDTSFDNDPTRHIQYGFEVIGADVWLTDRDPVGTAVVTTIPGDLNHNGKLDVGDVTTMMNALSDESDFATANGLTVNQLAQLGDLDGDGQFTNADIQALIGIVGTATGNATITSVPEPASFILLALGGLILLGKRAEIASRE